jgi:hypothetical protein
VIKFNWKKVLFITTIFPLILLFQNCSQFESIKTLNSVGNPTLQDVFARGLQVYSQNCAECHGLIDGSSVLNRGASQITSAIGSEPAMNHLRGIISDSDLQALENALNNQPETVIEPNSGRKTFSCQPNSVSLTPLLKLTNREYRNSINSLLQDVNSSLVLDTQLTTLFNSVPSDVIVEDRNTLKEQNRLITQEGFSSLFEAAWRAGGLIASNSSLNNYPNTSGCLASTTLSQTCFTSFLKELGTRAFRRPVNDSEAQALSTQLWDSNMSKAIQIQSAFTAIVQMPDFYYKAYNLGTPVQSGSTTLNITAHELASKVSYFLTGFPPDQTLRELANSGQITNPATLRQQVDRLLATNQSQQTIQRLFRESYGYDLYDTFTYPNSFLNGISTDGLNQAMTSELDTFFVNQVLSQNATFRDLLTSRNTTLSNTSLANIYGVSTGTNITLPVERSGFINRAAALAKRSGVRTSPIKRGLAVLEHVLCINVGLPPPSAPTALPPYEGEVLSTRQATARVSEASGTNCIGCHTRINNLGYPFEHFDTLGRVRIQESIYNSMGDISGYIPINTTATTNELGARAVNVLHSASLSSEIGNSDNAIMCFAKHLKRFESRIQVSSADNCHMNQVLTTLYGQGDTQGSVADSIRSLILSESFAKWRY